MKTRKPGRPPLDPSQRASSGIRINVTSIVAEAVAEAAEAAGKTRAEYARDAVMERVRLDALRRKNQQERTLEREKNERLKRHLSGQYR